MKNYTDLTTLVLKSYDVGEADRFLILFTKERGLLTARARAVRKLTSRLGGHLLPMHELSIDLSETRNGNRIVSGARLIHRYEYNSHEDYMQCQRGIEVLLSLLHEEEPLEDVFKASQVFLESPNVLPFLLRTLYVMGYLPGPETRSFYGPLEAEEIEQITRVQGGLEHPWNLKFETEQRLLKMCERVVEEHGSRKLTNVN